MKHLKRSFALAACALVLSASPAAAVYNANITGVVTMVLTYDADFILFRIDNQPTHSACSASLFAIGPDVATKQADRMYARLLLAYGSKEPVNIGYDSVGNCAAGYIRVHRVG